MKRIALFKVFSNEVRLKIFEFLLEGKMCVSGIVEKLDVTQPTVTQHLRILQQIGLIKSKKSGYWIHYFIDEKCLIEVKKELEKFLKTLQIKNSKCKIPSSQCPKKRKK